MKHVLRRLVVAGLVVSCSVAAMSTSRPLVAHAYSQACRSAQATDLTYTNTVYHLDNACFQWNGAYVSHVSGPSCSSNGSVDYTSSGWTQGSSTHGWFHCTFTQQFGDPQCFNPFQRRQYNLYLDVYANGTSTSHLDGGACV